MHVAATCKLRRDGASCIYLSKLYKTSHKSIDRDGRIPLHVAAYFCSANNTKCDEVVQSILGVSDEVTLFQKDKHGKDPAGIICQTGDLATVRICSKSIPQYIILSSKKRFDSVSLQYASCPHLLVVTEFAAIVQLWTIEVLLVGALLST